MYNVKTTASHTHIEVIILTCIALLELIINTDVNCNLKIITEQYHCFKKAKTTLLGWL